MRRGALTGLCGTFADLMMSRRLHTRRSALVSWPAPDRLEIAKLPHQARQ